MLLALAPLAHAEGAIDGWVHVHGHHYPVHPVRIQLFDANTGEAVPGLTTENRADGTYELTGIPNGEYKVHYDAYGDVWRYIDELAGNDVCDNAGCDMTKIGAVIRIEDNTLTLNTNLKEGVMMTGTVTDIFHRPLAGATVEFFDRDGEPHCCERTTDENGDWSRPLYFPESYYVMARYKEPSKYRPKLYSNYNCSGCDVASTGSRITFDYYTAFLGMKHRLEIVEPDPDIEVEPIARQKYSGSWYNPERDGEGFIVEVLDRPGSEGVGNEIVVFWFTYDPDGNQAWMVGTGEIVGRKAQVEFEATAGASFGTAFDPDDVERTRWGSLNLEFLNCESAFAEYGGSFGSGQISLERLTGLEDLGCGDPDDSVAEGNAALSGAWYNEQRDGLGFIMEAVGQNELLVYWFTYDTDGKQMWLLGTGEVNPDQSMTVNMLRASGGAFGDRFVPENVELEPWGDVTFQFEGCSEGTYSFIAPEPYGAGGFTMGRLTELKNAGC